MKSNFHPFLAIKFINNHMTQHRVQTNITLGFIKTINKEHKIMPGIAFICQEVLDLNMADTYISAPARARTHDPRIRRPKV